ncbi:MAG: O-antigen translocase [Paramuribaculum sp.]|nr:O-antigen translocase [Paramuribaculum sp.]
MAARADILKVFSLTSLSTLVRMCTGFISIKVVATIIGPSGVALLGQLNNFTEMTLSFSSGGINKGVTKYISEFKQDDNATARYISAGLKITVWCSLLCGAILIGFNRILSELILLNSDFGYIFIIFGFTVILYAFNAFLLSIVNGFKEFRRYVGINIAGNIVSLVFTVSLVLLWQLQGALIAAVTYQSVSLLITIWMLRKARWLRIENLRCYSLSPEFKAYARFSMMAIITALCIPVSQMLLRGYVMTELSETEAGWWEGMNRISAIYLMVITTSFSVYYLPRLSEIKNLHGIKSEILKSFSVIAPLLILGFVAIYLLRYFIIRLVFSDEFTPMANLFIWQMAGDFFKISSWLVAYIMVAKAMTRTYIATEIISTLIYTGLGFILVRINGIAGLCQAYLINYVIYSVTMIVIFRHLYHRQTHNQ